MRKFGGRVLSLILAAALLSSLTGCTTYNNFKNAFFSKGPVATEKTIKFGIYEPVSGQNKAQGKEEIMGIELAHELCPTVLGKDIELVYADNKSNMYDAETAIQELLTNSPSIVFGSYGETLTLVASDFIKATNTPAITISSTNPLITINNDYYFSATYTETRQGDALAEYAYTVQNRDVIATVKASNDDTGTATIKRFTNKIKNLTGNQKSVAGNFTISAESTDYTETIEKLRNSGAKAVFLALSPSMAQSFMDQCVKNNFTHVLFLGTRNWNDENLLKFVKSSDKLNVAFCGESAKPYSSELYDMFTEAYKAKYGEESAPDAKTLVAFDAYMMAVKAVEDAYNTLLNTDVEEAASAAKSDAEAKAIREAWQKAIDNGVPDGSQIKAALNKIQDFQGASGVISYDGKNEATKTISINCIENMVEKPLYVVE